MVKDCISLWVPEGRLSPPIQDLQERPEEKHKHVCI